MKIIKLNRAPVFLQLLAHRERGRVSKRLIEHLGMESRSRMFTNPLKPEFQIRLTRNEAVAQ